METELARCRRAQSTLTVVVTDLNGFKQVNDRFGHLEGNAVLSAVGRALRQACREYDFVARMGGDEFVLLFPGLDGEGVIKKIQRLNQNVIEAAEQACPNAGVSLSAGSARYPSDGTQLEQLLTIADQRMYDAKQRSKRNGPMRGYQFDLRQEAGISAGQP
jgi:diguanylate cyclase (GGDEF)-like protein